MFGDRFFGRRFYGNRFFGPAASGNQTITGVLYADPDTFGTAVIGRGAVSITGTLYTDADTFGAHTIAATYGITGVLYSDPDTFGVHTLSPGPVSITGSLYSDPDTFGTATLLPTWTIRANHYSDPDTFGRAWVLLHVTQYVSPGHERCMRCGKVRGESFLRKEWTGLIVCRDTCWEPRHPQMSLRGVPDNQTIPWARPVPTPVFLDPNDVQASDL